MHHRCIRARVVSHDIRDHSIWSRRPFLVVHEVTLKRRGTINSKVSKILMSSLGFAKSTLTIGVSLQEKQ